MCGGAGVEPRLPMPLGAALPTPPPRAELLLRRPPLPRSVEEDGEERGEAEEEVVREREGRGFEEGGEGLPFICREYKN